MSSRVMRGTPEPITVGAAFSAPTDYRGADPGMLTVAQLGAIAARIGMSLTELVSRWATSP